MGEFDEINAVYYNSRQIEKIRKVRVGIAGAGGLGSNCAAALVRAGFINITVVDFDDVSLLNLNRQFYFENQIGQKKVKALSENLRKINPNLNLSVFSQKITSKNIDSFFEDVNIVVEAFDTSESKALIANRFLLDEKYFICVSGLAGYGNSDRLKIREIGVKSWIIGDETCDVKNFSPLAPAVLICAAKQADKILEITLDLL
ncbi:MAG: sulfur carrier protein ThiS adenylyltransferase ThiF [Chitinispirillales bacterium]|nr:sulfur carrier protein ThiS adenylyltransferase ThiF [Chitinispirillales bacterium]